MYSREQYKQDMELATEHYEEVKRDLSKAEATLRLYEAYRKGVENIITENAAAGNGLEYITDLFLPEMEGITEKITETSILLEAEKQRFTAAEDMLDEANGNFGKMLAAERKGGTI